MKDPNKIDLGFSVDVATLDSANKTIQSITASIQNWIGKVKDLGTTTGTFDSNLKKSLDDVGHGYDGLNKKYSTHYKNKKKIEDFNKTLKNSQTEQTKYNKKLKESGKTFTDFARTGEVANRLNSKNQKDIKKSLQESMNDLDDFTAYNPKSQFVNSMSQDMEDFAGFDYLNNGLQNFNQEQEDILNNLNSSLDSVVAQTGRMNDEFDNGVLSLAQMGNEITENQKKASNFGSVFGSGLSKIGGTAQSLGRGLSTIPGGLLSSAQMAGRGLSNISKNMQDLSGKMVSGFKNVSSTIKDQAFNLTNLIPPLAAIGGAAGGIYSIKEAFESAWKSGQELEKMTVKMTNRFGSSDYAKKATGFINDMSQQYGLAKDDLESYTTELGEMGLSVDKVNFKGVLNAATGPGKDLQSTMSAMTALAKGGDFQSFTESFGNTIDPAALQEALAGASTYQERMQKTADFLDKQYSGNADRMKNSTEGQIASISGFFEKLQQTISGSGAFRAMQDVLTNIFNTIEANKDSILAVGQAIGSMMGTVIKFIGGLLGNVSGSMGGATEFFKSIVGKIRDIFYPIIFILGFIGQKIGSMIKKLFKGDLAGGVTDLGDIISMLIDGITGFVGKAFDLITGFFKWFNSQLPKLIPAVVAAAGKIIDSIVNFAKTLGAKVQALFPELLKTLGGLLKMIVPILKKLLIGAIQIIIDWTPRLASMLWDALVWVAEQLAYIGPELGKMLSEGLGLLGKWISDWIGGIADKLLKSDNPFLKWLGNVLIGLKIGWDSIISVLQGAVTAAGDIIGKIGEFFSSLFSGDFMDAGGKIFDIFDTIGSFIGDTFKNAFNSVLTWISSFLSDAASSLMGSDNPFMNFLGGLVQGFSDAITLIKNILSGVIDFVVGVFKDIGALIGNVFGNIFDMFKNLFTGDFSGAWENIKNIFGALWDFVKSLFGRIWTLIVDIFSSIGTYIWDSLKNLWKTFSTMLGNILGSIVGWIKDAWNSFTKFFSELPGKFGAAFSEASDQVMTNLKNLPDTIMNFFGSIPSKIGQLLSGGFGSMVNLGELIFGDGFFDPMIRMFKKTVNMVIDVLNKLPNVNISKLIIDDGVKEKTQSIVASIGSSFADLSKSTDLSSMVNNLNDEMKSFGDYGIEAGSAYSMAFETMKNKLYDVNKQLPDIRKMKDGVEKTAKLDEIMKLVSAIQSLSKSDLSRKKAEGEEAATLQKKSAMEYVGWISSATGEVMKENLASMNQLFQDSAVKPAVNDAIVKNGEVYPMNEKDEAIVSKKPGFIESIKKGNIMDAARAGVGLAKDVVVNTVTSGMNPVAGIAKTIAGSDEIKDVAEFLPKNYTPENITSSLTSFAQQFIGQKEVSKEVQGYYAKDKSGKYITDKKGNNLLLTKKEAEEKGIAELASDKKVSVGNLGFENENFNKMMKKYAGYSSDSISKLADDQIREGLAWCAAFAKTTYSGIFSSLPDVWSKIKNVFSFNAQETLANAGKSGYFELSKTNPKPGALVAWGKDKSVDNLEDFMKQNSFGSGHLGLVDSVAGGKFTTVEGNTGTDGEGREGVKVSRNTFPNSMGTFDKGKSLKFIGFANPKFDELLASIKNSNEPMSQKMDKFIPDSYKKENRDTVTKKEPTKELNKLATTTKETPDSKKKEPIKEITNFVPEKGSVSENKNKGISETINKVVKAIPKEKEEKPSIDNLDKFVKISDKKQKKDTPETLDNFIKSTNKKEPVEPESIKRGSAANPGKDFVVRPGQEPVFFEPTDTVFGVRKTVGLSEEKSPKNTSSSNSVTINFNAGSIQINSVNPNYDAKKLLEEIKTIIRREQGRQYGLETLPR